MAGLIIPTEPIGSIPRPKSLLDAIEAKQGHATDPSLEPLYEAAVRDTIAQFEATGSPVITDGEQRKYHNFWTYAVHGSPNTSSDGFKIPFAAGHTRRMPRLHTKPFRYQSALSLLYPAQGIADYPREQFISDLLHEHVTEVRRCLQKGAVTVQIDFTEGRLAMEIDRSGLLLGRFVELNNLALARFSIAERRQLGVHTCPGGDLDSTHSADVDYAELLPSLFLLDVRNFYVALASEHDRAYVLRMIRDRLKPGQRVFVGVVAPISGRIETPEEVRDRILEAARYIPIEQLGTTDDCGFAPFCDDQSTSRETAFAKIKSRVQGTALAAAELEGSVGQR